MLPLYVSLTPPHTWKSDYLGCAVLLCLVVCLFDLACFFLTTFSSLIDMYIHIPNVCAHVQIHFFGSLKGKQMPHMYIHLYMQM